MKSAATHKKLTKDYSQLKIQSLVGLGRVKTWFKDWPSENIYQGEGRVKIWSKESSELVGCQGKLWHERLSTHLNGRRRRLPQVMEEVPNHGYSPTRQQLAIQCFHIPGFLDAHCQIFWLRGGGRKCQCYAFKEIFVKSKILIGKNNEHL